MHARTHIAVSLRLGWMGLRSLSALALMAGIVVAGTWASGELAAWLALPAGGSARLAWDLAGVIVAGSLGFAALARLAPAAPRAHVAVALVLLLGVAAWAVGALGDDFPGWFLTALPLSLPLQAWAGWRLGGSRGRSDGVDRRPPS